HERVLTEWDSVLFGKIVNLRTICRDNWVCTAALDGTMNKFGEGELYDLTNDPLQHVNRWNDESVKALRDDLLSDLWANLPAQVLPLRNMDAPV
ncbi:MAG: sulfatase, partial [Acidimicrobiaceae bacterium]